MEFINKFFSAGLLLFLLEQIDASKAGCSDHKDCQTCASKTTTVFWIPIQCLWCPLTSKCHAKGSIYNKCTSSHYIQSKDKCPSTKNYKYDAAEAYKLALFSAVAYSNEPSKCLQALYPNSDYNVNSTLLLDCDDYLLKYKEKCMAFVTTSKQNKEVIVAFRGSLEIEQVYEQILIALLVPSASTAVGGNVQNYFDNVYKKFYDSLKKSIQDIRSSNPDYKVKVTGHSLGGAVASITSAMLVKENIVKSEDISLYTFGMPKVGDKDYAAAFDKLVPNSWRVVRKGDLIPLYPKCITFPICSILNGPFHHGNKVVYTDANMTKDSPYHVCDGNQDSLAECTKIEQEEASASRRRKRGAILENVELHTHYFGIRLGIHCLKV